MVEIDRFGSYVICETGKTNEDVFSNLKHTIARYNANLILVTDKNQGWIYTDGTGWPYINGFYKPYDWNPPINKRLYQTDCDLVGCLTMFFCRPAARWWWRKDRVDQYKSAYWHVQADVLPDGRKNVSWFVDSHPYATNKKICRYGAIANIYQETI